MKDFIVEIDSDWVRGVWMASSHEIWELMMVHARWGSIRNRTMHLSVPAVC